MQLGPLSVSGCGIIFHQAYIVAPVRAKYMTSSHGWQAERLQPRDKRSGRQLIRTRNADCGTECAWDNGLLLSWFRTVQGHEIPSPGSAAEQTEGAAVSYAVI
jgi:hypothetical protein